MTDEELVQSFENASRALRRSAEGSSAGPLGKRNGIENVYGQTYQALVNQGLAPRIRQKYRGQ